MLSASQELSVNCYVGDCTDCWETEAKDGTVWVCRSERVIDNELRPVSQIVISRLTEPERAMACLGDKVVPMPWVVIKDNFNCLVRQLNSIRRLAAGRIARMRMMVQAFEMYRDKFGLPWRPNGWDRSMIRQLLQPNPSLAM